MTFFGLGCAALVYLLGKEFYGKSAGLVAAALFGLNPWLLILSRSFLIDTQCLFFSLLTLFAGIFAIRKGTVRLASIAGLAFAAAFLTKFYAFFILIPLLMLYLKSRPTDLKHVGKQLTAFAVPVIAGAVLYYQVVLGRSILAILVHNDFNDVIPASTGVVPSPFFVGNFLIHYGLGWFLIAATVFSLFFGLAFRRHFPKVVNADLICLVTVAVVLGVNVFLGAVLNRNVPYFSAIKYSYQALPFIVLLAASLVAKGVLLLAAAKVAVAPKRLVLYAVLAAAAGLLASALVSTMAYTNADSMHDYLQFRVEPHVDYGYALSTQTPLTAGSPLLMLQYLGFVVVSAGLLWAGRRRLHLLFSRNSHISNASSK